MWIEDLIEQRGDTVEETDIDAKGEEDEPEFDAGSQLAKTR